jgi:hypothetical protein
MFFNHPFNSQLVAAIYRGKRGALAKTLHFSFPWNQKVTFESSAFAQHPLSYKHISYGSHFKKAFSRFRKHCANGRAE